MQNPLTLQKGDAIAVAGSTVTRTGLQLKLIKSPSQIFFYCNCISEISWSHQLIQWLCLKGGKKLHSFPSSGWCEHHRAQRWHSWRGKRRPCGMGSRFPLSISLNLVNKAVMRNAYRDPPLGLKHPSSCKCINKIQQPYR